MSIPVAGRQFAGGLDQRSRMILRRVQKAAGGWEPV